MPGPRSDNGYPLIVGSVGGVLTAPRRPEDWPPYKQWGKCLLTGGASRTPPPTFHAITMPIRRLLCRPAIENAKKPKVSLN